LEALSGVPSRTGLPLRAQSDPIAAESATTLEQNVRSVCYHILITKERTLPTTH